MNSNTYKGSVSHMDEYEADVLRTIELALQNPRTGTSAAREMHLLVEKTRHYEARRFPFVTHPRTGDICTCTVLCQGGACSCWCHNRSNPR